MQLRDMLVPQGLAHPVRRFLFQGDERDEGAVRGALRADLVTVPGQVCQDAHELLQGLGLLQRHADELQACFPAQPRHVRLDGVQKEPVAAQLDKFLLQQLPFPAPLAADGAMPLHRLGQRVQHRQRIEVALPGLHLRQADEEVIYARLELLVKHTLRQGLLVEQMGMHLLLIVHRQEAAAVGFDLEDAQLAQKGKHLQHPGAGTDDLGLHHPRDHRSRSGRSLTRCLPMHSLSVSSVSSSSSFALARAASNSASATASASRLA